MALPLALLALLTLLTLGGTRASATAATASSRSGRNGRRNTGRRNTGSSAGSRDLGAHNRHISASRRDGRAGRGEASSARRKEATAGAGGRRATGTTAGPAHVGVRVGDAASLVQEHGGADFVGGGGVDAECEPGEDAVLDLVSEHGVLHNEVNSVDGGLLGHDAVLAIEE